MSLDDFFGPELSLREEQKLRTGERILTAALDLFTEAGEDAVTIGAVASRAGVTERTVFRHVQSREKLVKSLWQSGSRIYPPPRPPRTPEELCARPRLRFQTLASERQLVRAYLHSHSRPTGPKRRLDRDRANALIRCIRTEMEYQEEAKLRRRAAIVDLLASPYALEFMQQFWGFSGKQAGKAAAEAIEILLNRALAY